MVQFLGGFDVTAYEKVFPRYRPPPSLLILTLGWDKFYPLASSFFPAHPTFQFLNPVPNDPSNSRADG
jgi:hypothetical protein